jgi:hypothetical protein
MKRGDWLIKVFTKVIKCFDERCQFTMDIDAVIGDSVGGVGGKIFRNTASEYVNG